MYQNGGGHYSQNEKHRRNTPNPLHFNIDFFHRFQVLAWSSVRISRGYQNHSANGLLKIKIIVLFSPLRKLTFNFMRREMSSMQKPYIFYKDTRKVKKILMSAIDNVDIIKR